MKAFSIFCITILAVTNVIAQDLHFSSPNGATLASNPAHSGNYSGDFRFSNTYRSQWYNIARPYSTIALQYDRQFYYRNDAFGAGCILIKDDAGTIGLNSFTAALSGSYKKNINRHYTILGIQMGYGLKYFSPDEVTLPDQFDKSTGHFNNQIETEDHINNQMISFLQLNAGIIWHYDSEKFQPEVGIAAFNMNRPCESFSNTKQIFENLNDEASISMAMRSVIHASAECVLTEKVAVKPYGRFMYQKKSNEVLFGLNTSYLFSEESTIESANAGMYARANVLSKYDAIILAIGANTNKISLQLVYDINISELHLATKYQGAFELSFVYKGINTMQRQSDKRLIRF